jgi:hypothetical protein
MASTSTTYADGVIIGGLGQTQDNCTATTTKVAKMDFGVIIGGLTGVIIGGFTGVIIGGIVATPPTQNCGVIIGG